MPLPLDKLCICPISFYRMLNYLQEARNKKKMFIIVFILLFVASVGSKCYIVE